ncbi:MULTISPECIES: hypothetical protein [Ramlibacter]|uniref:Fenitrothion hydrolase n=1 Tax=Ramlibacter pinisoli TaxID=2682844 RepID=A0A6N8IW30_9BURK|nr:MULTISPECIES: hypothetical protein [Ramlibacter]MBA2961093.1 hypothetical protein [Ramlibacter sp. CGMCC 1.13660]MVQ31037.1 hypothetical protein [Ramlibacter pinisoli]
MRACARAVLSLTALLAAGATRAHALQERYDLPLPLAYVVAGGCLAVVLTFAAAALFARRGAGAPREARALAVPAPLLAVTRTLGLVLFLLAVASALWGTRDPLMNLTPTLVWIVAWLGLSLTCAFVADVWPLLDPWRTLHAGWQALWRRPAPTPRRHWPARIGVWPAVLLLLAWSWMEVVDPRASSPARLGALLLAWTAVNLGGMAAFGRAAWQAHADLFAVVFATFGRMAPWRLASGPAAPPAAGLAALVMALLATVIFDGLHGAAAWELVDRLVRTVVPAQADPNGFIAGAAGLVAVWLAFLLLYQAALHASLALLGPSGRDPALPPRIALTLVPIAAAYHLAHNFSTLVLQGQRIVALLSDPFGLQWDLFGTARYYPDIAWLDARITWFVATGAILAGHAASIWWSHRVVLATGVPRRRAAAALVPLTLLMVAFTASSLVLLAAAQE